MLQMYTLFQNLHRCRAFLPLCLLPSAASCCQLCLQLLPDAAALSSMQGTPASSIFPMGDKDAFGRGRRYPTSDKAAVCSGRCSSKSPSTDAKVNYLVIRYLRFRSVRGGLDLCSPSTALKVNCLVIRDLHF